MNKKLTIIGLTLLMFGLVFAISGESSLSTDVSHIQSDYESINNGYADYDALKSSQQWPNPYFNNMNSRSTADTMSYCPDVGGQFVFTPGDYMLVMYQMPADGIIKGVNIPVFEWADTSGASEDGLKVSLYKLNYPNGSDGSSYPTDYVDGSGWMGYAWDGADHGTADIEGDSWYGDVEDETGTCADKTAIPNVLDPLSEKIWPLGFQQATFGPSQVEAQVDNWLNTVDYGAEPELVQGDWVGILIENQGTMVEYTGFYYCEGDGVVDPWIFAKFYDTECDGTSGETGWHLRHWVVHFPLAVELTGDRAPIISDVTELPTTLSTEARTVEATITDDNPAGGDAGVASATLFWSIDGETYSEVVMTAEADDYTGDIPGQAPGTTVTWYLEAIDVLDNASATVAKTYNVFAPVEENLVIYNSDLFGSWITGYYLDSAPVWYYDVWSYGTATSELIDNYNTILEISGGGPLFCNDTEALGSWLDTGDKNYINAGDEWMGACIDGWAPTDFAEGDFVYDYLGIAASIPDFNYGTSGDQSGISRLMAVDDDAISGDLADFLADSLDLNYDPVYEIGASNWLDGADAVEGATVSFTGYSGILDENGNVAEDAVIHNTALYNELPNGSKTAWFGFDVLSLNTSPSYYWIGIQDFGPLPKTLTWMGEEIVGIQNTPETPKSFELYNNYPNPFNPVTEIKFDVPTATNVELKIYNLLGAEVTTLHNDYTVPGTYTKLWNGTNDNGLNVPSGVYFYRIQTDGFVKTGKMILLK